MSKTLKIPCGCTCPNCGESNGFYITENVDKDTLKLVIKNRMSEG